MKPQNDRGPPDGAAALMAALPPPALDPGFSRRVLGSAQLELATSRTRWQRTERLFARVLVPASLLVCAARWTHEVVGVAQRVYLHHAPATESARALPGQPCRPEREAAGDRSRADPGARSGETCSEVARP